MKSLLSAVSLALLFLPGVALAHSAGALDAHGCHDDRRRGEYHCHVGEYRGLKFTSKAAFLKARKGKTVAELRKEQGIDDSGKATSQEEEEGGWLSWVPFLGRSRSGTHDVGSGEVIVPRGIEERLRVAKDLYDKGLISEQEYSAKRKEILGEL